MSPSKDRLNYGDMLTPPYGYKLDFAVGTTYSLDLDALVGASMALGLSEDPDSDELKDPICLLEALRSIGDKIALFCESGQIHFPGKVTPLYILLEKIVFSVALKRPGRQKSGMYPSFHPKFWLIRYVSDEDVLYRVIVLSRNLTFDRSWDVSFSMDGVLKGQSRKKNRPLSAFLDFLAEKIPNTEDSHEKRKAIRALTQEIPYVQFEIQEKEFTDYTFIPQGIRLEDGNLSTILNTPLFDKNQTFHEVFAISPFVSSDVIKMLNDSRGDIEYYDYSLITRAASLGSIKEQDVTNFKLYTVKDEIVDGESLISEESSSIQKQDIHAKVFMTRKYSDTNLYLGSLNATHAALYSNVEFVIKLQSSNRYLNAIKLRESLFGADKDNPFQEVKLQDYSPEEVDDDTSMLEIAVKDISRANPYGRVIENDDKYDITLQFNPVSIDTHYEVTIQPLLSQREQPFSNEIVFTNLDAMQISEFFTVIVKDENQTVKRLIKIQLNGIPDERERRIVSSVINNRDKFYKYITFLLGEDAVISTLEMNEIEGTVWDGEENSHQIAPALYEKMLKAVSEDPDKMKGIDYLIRMTAEDNVVPESFIKLYETIKKAVGIK